MTRRVLDREIPGIPEALRAAGAAAGVPSAILSRGLAGVASRTLIINLPGSSGGVRDGMKVLRAILVHAVDQIRGGDHQRPAEHSQHEHSHAEQGHAERSHAEHGQHSHAEHSHSEHGRPEHPQSHATHEELSQHEGHGSRAYPESSDGGAGDVNHGAGIA
jgi:hypothetical protein